MHERAQYLILGFSLPLRLPRRYSYRDLFENPIWDRDKGIAFHLNTSSQTV
jgi:hypothetical protein